MPYRNMRRVLARASTGSATNNACEYLRRLKPLQAASDRPKRYTRVVRSGPPGTTRSRHRLISEEIYFAVSKIHGFTVLDSGFECERPEVFRKHGTRKVNAFGMRD